MQGNMRMMQQKQAIIAAACALAIPLCFSSCESYPQDKATAIVTAPYPGKNNVFACKVYADALSKALASKHIPVWRVYYWRNNKCGPTGHAIVVYKDAGSYWSVDNEFPYPAKCWGTTPREWAEERDAMWLNEGGGLNTPLNFQNTNAIVAVSVVEGGKILTGNSKQAALAGGFEGDRRGSRTRRF
jgi:hypothetical protein